MPKIFFRFGGRNSTRIHNNVVASVLLASKKVTLVEHRVDNYNTLDIAGREQSIFTFACKKNGAPPPKLFFRFGGRNVPHIQNNVPVLTF